MTGDIAVEMVKRKPAPSGRTFGSESKRAALASAHVDSAEAGTSAPAAANEPQSQYRRIELQESGRWAVLVPAPTNSASPGSLIHLGAEFSTAEAAALAADRALIATCGREAAAGQLNFAPERCGPEAQRRYGPALSAHLADICREAARGGADEGPQIATKKRARGSRWVTQMAEGVWHKERAVLRRMRKDPLFVDPKQPCGVCPPCREPWESAPCRRTDLMRRLKYTHTAAARMQAYGPEGVAVQDLLRTLSKTDKAAAQRLRELTRVQTAAAGSKQAGGGGGSSESSGSESESSESSGSESESQSESSDGESEPGTSDSDGGNDGRGAQPEAAAEVTGRDGAAGRHQAGASGKGTAGAEELIWLVKPRKSWADRLQHNTAYERLQRHEAQAAAAADAAAPGPAAGAPQWQELLLPDGLSAARPPRDYFNPLPHHALLRQLASCAAEGADVALVGEDDPRWVAPPAADVAHQCALCRGRHGAGGVLYCPVLQATNAVAKPAAGECAHCLHREAPGCERCSCGTLAPSLWVPERMRTPWVDAVRPATLGVMHAVQGAGGAAVVDLDCPELTAKLGPKALLAMGLLAEEVAAAELRSRMGGGGEL